MTPTHAVTPAKAGHKTETQSNCTGVTEDRRESRDSSDPIVHGYSSPELTEVKNSQIA